MSNMTCNGTNSAVTAGTVVAAGLVLLLLAGCVSNALDASDPPGPGDPPTPMVELLVNATWQEGETATLTLSWIGGTGPCTIRVDMGGGTVEEVPADIPAQSPFTQTFTLLEGTWTYTATVFGADGAPGTATGTYDVGPALSTAAIDRVWQIGPTLYVQASSSTPGDTITVTVTEPPGLTVDASSKAAAQTSGTAVFHWTATDIVAGGSGETTITATNGGGATDTATATIEITPPGPVLEGMLVAMPTSASALAGEPVTIVVIGGPLPANAPFRHMNGVAVSFDHRPSDFTNFNIGAPGGDRWHADGIWAAVQPNGFTTGWEWWPYIRDAGGGSWQLDFSLFTLEGAASCGGGALFSFDVVFDTPGEVHVGLAAPIIWGHEYPAPTYSDDEDAINEHVWLDYSNEYVPNTITVTE
jgi:hypothetical protein